MEGFNLLVKWMAKHHLGLVVDDVEKELMSDRPFEAIAENVSEGATDTAKVMKEALANPVPNEQ